MAWWKKIWNRQQKEKEMRKMSEGYLVNKGIPLNCDSAYTRCENNLLRWAEGKGSDYGSPQQPVSNTQG